MGPADETMGMVEEGMGSGLKENSRWRTDPTNFLQARPGERGQ
jgi:hypothetical protein